MRESNHPTWRVSSYTSNGESCVEVAPVTDGVLLRDTKDAGAGPTLTVAHLDWSALLADQPTSALRLVERDARTRHAAGREVTTRWHLSDASGVTLHFTATEWVAFRAGVAAGEFDFVSA